MDQQGRRFYLTDVFCTKKYSGNQLAVFTDCEGLSDQDMQQIAREINFSETTFVFFDEINPSDFRVRIFTPLAEVPFAGHPVLGTAWVIREKILRQSLASLTLQLAVDAIDVQFAGVDEPLWMRQPQAVFGKQLLPSGLAAVLGLDEHDIDADFPVLEVSTGFPHVIVPLRSQQALTRIRVDRTAELELVDAAWAKNILVFAPNKTSSGQALAVRVFADFYGIAEDAATGSGNGALAAWLSFTGFFGSSRVDTVVGQGYEMGRPSELHLRAMEDDGNIQVEVGGLVVGVAEGFWQ